MCVDCREGKCIEHDLAPGEIPFCECPDPSHQEEEEFF